MARFQTLIGAFIGVGLALAAVICGVWFLAVTGINSNIVDLTGSGARATGTRVAIASIPTVTLTPTPPPTSTPTPVPPSPTPTQASNIETAIASNNLLAYFTPVPLKTMYVCVDSVDVHAGPGRNYPVVFALSRNGAVTVHAQLFEWLFLGYDEKLKTYNYVQQNTVCDPTPVPGEGTTPTPVS